MSGLPSTLVLSSWFWVIAACGGEPPLPADDRPVTGTVQTPPALVMYREATETAWQPVTMTSPTSFELRPRGPYLVTVVCEYTLPHGDWPGFVMIQQIAQTPDDPRELSTWCLGEGPHLVTVNYVPNQNLFGAAMGGAQWWLGETIYQFWMQPGNFDLFATSAFPNTSTPDRIMIQRNIPISGDTTLPEPIDLDLEGKPAVQSVLTHSNPDPTENLLFVHVELMTPRGWGVVYWSPRPPVYRAALAPNSILEPSDIQTLMMETRSGQGMRGVRRRIREGDSTIFTLPEFVNGITFAPAGSKPTFTWTALPEHARIRSWMHGLSADSSTDVFYDLTYSRSYEEAMGVSSAMLEADIPGYRPEWQIDLDLSKQYAQRAFIERDDGNDTLYTGTSVTVMPSMPAAGAPGDPLDAHPALARYLRTR